MALSQSSSERTGLQDRSAGFLKAVAKRVEAPLSQRKVVLLNRFFYPDESATSQLLTDLAEKLVNEGYSVTAVTGRAQMTGKGLLAARERYRGIEIRRVRTALPGTRSILGKLAQYGSFYPGALLQLFRLLRQGDVVIAKTDPPLISVAAMVAAKARRAKLVNWIQDLYPEVAARLGTPFVRGFVGQGLARLRNRALLSAEANVVIGSRMAERLAALGVQPSKTRIIPNWADEDVVEPVQPAASMARVRWGLKDSDFVVGYSGNLGRAHEVDTLIGAAVILRARPEVKFLFIGGGRHHSRLRSLVEQQDLQNFLFEPHQPREELADTLAASDVHWLSLRPELEGLIVPSKLYGILAAGRPVIAVCDPAGEVSAVVNDHGCGIVVRPGDSEGLARAITLLVDDPRSCEAMACRAREASQQAFSKSRALGAWLRIVAAAINDRRGTDL